MITIELDDDCFHSEDVVIISKVVRAITNVTFPDDVSNPYPKLSADEHALAQILSEGSLYKRRKLAKDLTKRHLLTEKQAAKAAPDRSYTLRYPNRFTVERDVWDSIDAAVTAGRIRPFVLDNRQRELSPKNYRNGGFLFAKLVEWGQSTGLYDFLKYKEDAPENKNIDAGADSKQKVGAATESDDALVVAKRKDMPVNQTNELKPWEIADPKDPVPAQPWYTPARYFARQLVIVDSTLLTKRPLLAGKVVQSLTNAGINKRGGKKPFTSGTILKALANVSLG